MNYAGGGVDCRRPFPKPMAKQKPEPAEAPEPNEPNPPKDRAVKGGMVRIRNVSKRDLVDGETVIKPGEEAEVPEDRAMAYAHRVRRV
jgi:hypothetical protein